MNVGSNLWSPNSDQQCHLERFLLVTRELMELGENFKVFYFNQTTDALIPLA